jgi:hypothetical protein
MPLPNLFLRLCVIFTVLSLGVSMQARAPSLTGPNSANNEIGKSDANSDPGPGNLTLCPTRSVELCTSIFKPVCASRDTGVRCVRAPCPSLAPTTYGNACSACRDPKVYGYLEGACVQASPAM